MGQRGKRILLLNRTAMTGEGGRVVFNTPDVDNAIGTVANPAKHKAGWMRVNVSSIAIGPFLCWLQSHVTRIALKIDVEERGGKGACG